MFPYLSPSALGNFIGEEAMYCPESSSSDRAVNDKPLPELSPPDSFQPRTDNQKILNYSHETTDKIFVSERKLLNDGRLSQQEFNNLQKQSRKKEKNGSLQDILLRDLISSSESKASTNSKSTRAVSKLGSETESFPMNSKNKMEKSLASFEKRIPKFEDTNKTLEVPNSTSRALEQKETAQSKKAQPEEQSMAEGTRIEKETKPIQLATSRNGKQEKKQPHVQERSVQNKKLAKMEKKSENSQRPLRFRKLNETKTLKPSTDAEDRCNTELVEEAKASDGDLSSRLIESVLRKINGHSAEHEDIETPEIQSGKSLSKMKPRPLMELAIGSSNLPTTDRPTTAVSSDLLC